MNDEELMAVPETVAEQLARYRDAKAKREELERLEKDANELARFQLVDRLESELHGKEGRDFAIVDLTKYGEGFIAVKLGEAVHWKSYSASKMNEVDTEVFVIPNLVHPSKEEYRKIVMRRPFAADRSATALADLYGVDLQARTGK